MIIRWYDEKGHLFNSKGNAPLIGRTVYFRDLNNHNQQIKYEVVSVSDVLVRSLVCFSALKTNNCPPDQDILEYAFEKTSEISGGLPETIIDKQGISFIKHEIDVVLKKISD